MELTAIANQTVEANRAVIYTDEPVRGNGSMYYREGSGIVNLLGAGPQFRALFEVSYQGNIAIAEGGTPGAISVAIAVQGEPQGDAVGIVTPAAVGDYFSMSFSTLVAVPRGCCTPVSVINTSAQTIDVQNSNLLVRRIA